MERLKAAPIALCLLLLAAGGCAANRQAPIGPRSELAGEWTMNEQDSSLPGPAGRAGGRGPGGRGGGRGSGMPGGGMRGSGGGRGGRPGGGGGAPMGGGGEGAARARQAMEVLVRGAERLYIQQDDSTVTVVYADGTEYRLRADGRETKSTVQALGEVKVKTRWRDGALQVERRLSDGIKVTDVFSRGPGSSRLVVETKIHGVGPQPLELKRVYDPAGSGGS